MELSSILSKPLITVALNTYRDRKRDKLLDKLVSSKIQLDDSKLKSDSFISAFVKTEEAIQKAESQEKFDFLLSLYIRSIESELIFEQPDLYHEVIHTLGEMSCREISFLYLLDDYSRENKETEENFREFNQGLDKLFQSKLNLNYAAQQAMTRRLYRTGFVSSISTVDGGIWPRISLLYNDVLFYIHQSWESTSLYLK